MGRVRAEAGHQEGDGHRGDGQREVRRRNLSAVLRRLHVHGEASRAELTEHLGLNRSTVGDLVGELGRVGLVDVGAARRHAGQAGRPSPLVRTRPEAASVLAVHVDVRRLEVVRVGLGGQVLDRDAQVLPDRPAPADVVDRVAAVARRAFPPGSACGGSFAGVGVAVPGTVRTEDGTVAVAPHLGWEEVPLAAALREALTSVGVGGAPVRVANDADLGVLAERSRGAARGAQDVIYVCGTWGLGGGIVSGGRALDGHQGFAGEIGHVSVDASGRACRCGSRGCWETEALAGAWAEPLGLDASAPDIARRVLDRLAVGDVLARRTRDRVSRSFARGLASVANVLDPQVVVLGDGLWRELWPVVADDVLPWLQRLVIPVLRGQLPVVPAGLGADSPVLGAAETAFGRLLDDPLSDGRQGDGVRPPLARARPALHA